ncbi:hypothetical protein GCM10027162_54660 [Streptomyces incanus]
MLLEHEAEAQQAGGGEAVEVHHGVSILLPRPGADFKTVQARLGPFRKDTRAAYRGADMTARPNPQRHS